MTHVVAGIFKDSQKASDAASLLKPAGFTDKISVISKKGEEEIVNKSKIKGTEPGEKGAAVGAVIGGVAGILAGAASVILPGLGTLLVAGPFALIMGATGAMSGGLIGGLVSAGVPEDQARRFEDGIKRGEALVLVAAEHDDESKVRDILDSNRAEETTTRHTSYAGI